uniref:HECT-type E3 ubiquitin transferase n=1 Tax=Sinocyclocheilus grahami TaxID=75366 RepID=A0A672LZH9_SINGR
PSYGSFISTLNHKRESGSHSLSSPLLLPAVRQGQTASSAASFSCFLLHNLILLILLNKFYPSIVSALGDWKQVHDFYLTTFDSFLELNGAFKKEANAPFNTIEDSGINIKFVNIVYDALLHTPADTQKSVLKGIINSLLREWKGPRTKDDLRAYFVLVQNPQYTSPATYVIYAHLLRQIAALAEADHHFLMHWFKKLPQKRFKQLVERLQLFITTRLFPAKPEELPPMAKCSWWIPSATKVLSLLNAANSISSPPIIPFTDLYNLTLDHIDFMEDYHTWQAHGNSNRFTFCQFPFILSTVVKKAIIQRDSEQQMISMARQTLVDKVSRRQRVDMSLLFLNIKVRRLQLVSDSLDELSRKRADLKKKLKVTFVGEAGLDMGGLTKEWFLLLIRQIFHTDYGMFTYVKESQCHWFSSWKCDNYSEFRLVGALMGLAVYNSITLDIRFPPCVYKKLLTPPIVPCDLDTPVGMATLTLDDLQQIMPVCTQVFQEELGVVKSYNLKPGGDKIPVTNLNRKEYVQLYIDFLLNKSIYRQFAAFYHGFHSVCASNALMLLRPEEVEILVCGSPNLDMGSLQRVVQYEGYSKTDPTIRYMSLEMLLFTLVLQCLLGRGADCSEMTACKLPVSHTCFNQICLPPYKSKKELRQKLTIAISNAEGFGLE